MSKVKNIPRLRFPEFRDHLVTEKLENFILEIGSGWSPICLDRPAKKGEWGSLKTTSISWGGYNPNENKKLPIKVDPKENLEVVYDDILITRVGPKDRVGVVAHVNDFRPKLLVSDNMFRLKVGNGILPPFLPMILGSNSVQKLWKRKTAGLASAQVVINQKILNNTYLTIPSLPEQQKIADFLTAVDKRIELLEKKKTLLETYKKGVMKKIFNQEIRFKDDNGNDFPDWEEKSLGDIGEFKTSSVDKKLDDNEQEVFLVNYMNVYRHEKITNENKHDLMVVTAKPNQIDSNNLLKGDILFTPSSETPDDIGHSVVIFEDLDDTLYSYHLLRFRPTIKIDILFSHYFCNNDLVLNQICRLATGSTRFTISKDSFSKILINLPCVEEQSKIAWFLDSIDKQLELLETQIDKSKTWKKGLLQKMFV